MGYREPFLGRGAFESCLEGVLGTVVDVVDFRKESGEGDGDGDGEVLKKWVPGPSS